MVDTLFMSIQRHLTHLDYIKKLSLYILDLIESEKTEHLDGAIENRLRLINITSKNQQEVESLLAGNFHPNLYAERDIIHSWSKDTMKIIAEIEQIDQLIQTSLEELKAQTAKQISHLFKSRESFKGYNLSSTKR